MNVIAFISFNLYDFLYTAFDAYLLSKCSVAFSCFCQTGSDRNLSKDSCMDLYLNKEYIKYLAMID